MVFSTSLAAVAKRALLRVKSGEGRTEAKAVYRSDTVFRNF